MAAHDAFFMFIAQISEVEMIDDCRVFQCYMHSTFCIIISVVKCILHSSSRIFHNCFFYFMMEMLNTLCTLMWPGMAPFYEEVCRDLDWKVDHTLLAKMKSANDEHLKELEETIEDAEKNLGEMEVREASLKKSEYLCRIGDKVFFIY